MSLIGWGPTFWAPHTTSAIKTDFKLLTSLAGNAFSGFAVAPVVLCAFIISGLTPEDFGKLPPAIETDSDASGGYSSSSSTGDSGSD
jgi:hypothetical protein